MDKALTNYGYVRKYGNSYIIVVSKECDILKIKNGELVRYRITKIQPEDPEEVAEAPQEAPPEEVSQPTPVEEEKPKKNSKKKKKTPAEPE